jgi:prepilin-type N-terminal cleavage/methylation domain-containing protein
MAKPAFWSRLTKNLLKSRRYSSQGFTLLELLVVTAIAGGIVAGLTYVVVQMMTADQREASRSETQREMQLALDYISSELREAIYVYPGEYLECTQSPSKQACESITQFLPAAVSQDSVPVLAFWKQQPFPTPIKNQCVGGNAPAGTACLAGQSYALVVYSLRKNDNNGIWKGKARITRYVLSQFNSRGELTAGYVDPGRSRNFTTWPYGNNPDNNGRFENLQAARPDGSADTLVDYVGFNYLDAGVTADLGRTGFCPDLPTEAGAVDEKEYSISPSNNMLKGDFSGVRSFYACVAAPTTSVRVGGTPVVIPDATQYRDIIVYLRGSATGRPGILSDQGGLVLRNRDQDILPTLQTRVLSRSVLGRRPTE